MRRSHGRLGLLLAALLILALVTASGCDVVARVLSDENVQQALLSELTAQLNGTEAPGTSVPGTSVQGTSVQEETAGLDENGHYTEKDDVAAYLHAYGRLPENFMTKKEAQALGWSGGSLERVAPGMCIGGDAFGNREGLLPKKKGRTYTECDIGTLGKSSRGAKRIVFSNDGLIFYTDDHYESFTLLYGEE